MSCLSTFWVACSVRLYHLRQFFRNFSYYYLWHLKFFLADMLLLSFYFFKSPYRLVREYDQLNPEMSLGPYGESDFYTAARIFSAFSIPKTASVVELGSGRGRLCLWLSMVRGQEYVCGIEALDSMSQRARRIQRWFCRDGLDFYTGNWHAMPLPPVDVYYLYAAAETDEQVREMAHALSRLRKGSRIITIGWWLGEGAPENFVLEKTLSVKMEWGKSRAFLQKVVSSSRQ